MKCMSDEHFDVLFDEFAYPEAFALELPGTLTAVSFDSMSCILYIAIDDSFYRVAVESTCYNLRVMRKAFEYVVLEKELGIRLVRKDDVRTIEFIFED